MAKRPSKSRTESNEKVPLYIETGSVAGWWERIKEGASSEQFRVIMGVLLGLFTLYLTLAFVSFFFTGAADFSIMELSRAERAANRLEITNIMGLPGAALVFLLVHKTFGLSSVVLLAWMVLCTLRLFRVGRFSLMRYSAILAFWLLYGSVVLGFVDHLIGEPLFFRLGGALGAVLTAWGLSYLKGIGLFFVLLAIGVIFFICVDDNTIPRMKQLAHWVQGLFRKKEKKEEPATADSGDEPTKPAEDEPDGSKPIELIVTPTDDAKPEPEKPEPLMPIVEIV